MLTFAIIFAGCSNNPTNEAQLQGDGPEASFTATPTSGDIPLTVSFTDQSIPGNSAITTWQWNFGDGQFSNEQHPQHTYTVPGRYTVALTVSDGNITDATAPANLINATDQSVSAPLADFSANPTSGQVPLTVEFTDLSVPGTNPIASWLWEFGDGQASTARNPQYTYVNPGNYTVKLTVSDGSLSHSKAPANLISATDQNLTAPTADFDANPTRGEAPLSVNFTDQSIDGTNPISSWLWEFGDGETSTEQNPNHVYQQPGLYTVKLTVSDGSLSDSHEPANLITSEVAGNSDHAHFDYESSRPGVVGSVTWRNQAEIDNDEYGANSPGDPAYPVYDPAADAAKMGIIDGEGLSQLRHYFPMVSGSVWTQHEMMLDPVLFSGPFDPVGMKLWRWRDDSKTECTDERRLTKNISFGPDPIVYHRDGCRIPDGEVRVENSDGVYDNQPGGETECLYENELDHPDCFRWAPGVWTRLTYHFDFAGRKLHIWARRMDTDVLRKIVDFDVPDWNANYGFDVSGPWLHSTGRTHNEWPSNLPDAYIYARNMIVSTQPITQ